MSEQAQGSRPRRGWKIAVMSLIAVLIAGGGIGAATADTWLPQVGTAVEQLAPTPSPTPSPTALPVTVALTPATGAVSVNPATPVVAEATNGTVSKALLTNDATGDVVAGELFVSGRKWISQAPLVFNASYTLAVTTADTLGKKTTHTSVFSTVPATHEADLVMYPSDGATVGVAQPLQFNFSEPVLNKEAVENAITITTATGVPGSFRWYSDTLVRYRAADFWPANSPITVEMNLLGLDIGNGMIGNFNKTNVVNIGNKTVMEADAAAHHVNIFVNDVLAQSFPATLGDADFPSASGYMVLTADKQRYATFRAATIGLKPGDPGDYGSVDVEYATRLSNSGIFIHQATPSAMPYLGTANLSHGCIGLSPTGAAWVFNNMLPGDLVHTVGTPNETIAATDGFGDWNIPYAAYASR